MRSIPADAGRTNKAPIRERRIRPLAFADQVEERTRGRSAFGQDEIYPGSRSLNFDGDFRKKKVPIRTFIPVNFLSEFLSDFQNTKLESVSVSIQCRLERISQQLDLLISRLGFHTNSIRYVSESQNGPRILAPAAVPPDVRKASGLP